jgi:protocatechuate 3,4-dioxygenase beta subunit
LESKHILIALLCLLLCGGGLVAFLLQGDTQDVDYVLAWETADEEPVEPENGGTLSGEALEQDGDDEADRLELDDGEVADGPGGKPAREARPPVVIHGRVVTRFRTPVAGASIKLSFGRPGRRGRRGQVRVPKPVVTGKDGIFVFQGKGFRDLEVSLQITHDDYALALHRDTFQSLDTDSDVDVGEIEVATGGSMTGNITDMAGVVLPGAAARLLPQDGRLRNMPQRWQLFPSIKTNNSGFFHVEHIPPGQYRVEGVAPHRQRRYTDIITVTDAEEVVLDPIQLGPGFELRGRVFKPEGGAVEKAEVSLLSARGGGRAQRRRTDKEGQFSFDHLAAGNYALRVQAKGYLQYDQNGIQVESAPEVNLTLVNGLRVAGIVLDATTNQPVTSYAARVRRVGSLPNPAMARLRAEFEGLRQKFQQSRGRLRGRQRRQMETKLRQAAMKLRESGVAVDPRGRPRRGDGGRDRNRNRNRNPAWQNLPRDAGKPQPHPDGKFSFDGLQEGFYVVDFSSPKHQRVRSERIEMRRGGMTPYLTLYMERGLLVAGTVLDKQSGEPIPNARVDLLIVQDPDPPRNTNNRRNPWQEVRRQFQAPGPQRGISFLNTRTDKKGEFRMQQAGQGTYLLVARAGGHARGFTDPFDLISDIDSQELRLGRLGVIHGRVHAIPPDKVDKARVIVTDLRRNKIVKVKPDMTYRAEDLHPGNYMVRAFVGSLDAYRRGAVRRFVMAGSNPSQVRPDVKIDEGSVVKFDASIDQDPVGDLKGQILVNGFGSAAKGFRLDMREINPMGPNAPRGPGAGGWRPNRYSAVVDQKGRYRLKDMATGQYTMSIRAAGRRGREVHRQTFYVHADRQNAQPAITLMLGTFTGTVIPAASKVPAGRKPRRLHGNVQLLPGVTEMPKDPRAFRRANLLHNEPVRNGKFTFKDLPVGDYLMVLRVNGFAPKVRTVFADGSPVAAEYQTGKRRGARKPRGKKPGGKKPGGKKPGGKKPGGKKPGGKARPKGASGRKPPPKGQKGRNRPRQGGQKNRGGR